MQIISTLPRSGTWYTKYLLSFFYNFAAGKCAPIGEIYEHVTRVAAAGLNLEELEKLRAEGDFGSYPVVPVTHLLCPGFLDLRDDIAEKTREVLKSVDALDFHVAISEELAPWSPLQDRQSRICFVCRNPFDVFISYARRFNDRACLAH